MPRHGAVKKAQEKKLDVAEMRMLRWMCAWSHQAGQNIRNDRIRGTTNGGEMDKNVQVEVVWACIEKRRRICRQESDGDVGAGEKKEL